jgi:hypothetical protein
MGGSVAPPVQPPPRDLNLEKDAQLIAEIRRRQENVRRGTQNLLIIPTSTALGGDTTGLRIP